jgi:Domain of unknown function (DUF1963)
MKASLPEELLARLDGLKRTAWLPETVDGDAEIACSKFGGRAWLPKGEDWPKCGRCGKPMALFLQLHLSSLPEEARGWPGDGLLQMFYCVSRNNCVITPEGLSPFSPYQLVRRIDPSLGAVADLAPVLDRFLNVRTITRWNPVDDYPSTYELQELGIKLDDETSDALFDMGLTARQRDKLAGWPSWVQCVDYPKCRICGRALRLIFEIQSMQNLFYSFGDCGCGQITGCPDHPGELAFFWQCF